MTRRRSMTPWRRGRRLATAYLAIVAAIVAVCWGGLAVWHYTLDPNRDAADATKITAPTRTVAVLEMADCVARGESCQTYEAMRDYLAKNTSPEFEYTPLTDADPGQDTGNGTRSINLATAQDAEVQAVAEAITRGGVVTPGGVDPSTIAAGPDDSYAAFPVPGASDSPALTGMMTFSAATSADVDDQRLLSVTYKEDQG